MTASPPMFARFLRFLVTAPHRPCAGVALLGLGLGVLTLTPSATAQVSVTLRFDDGRLTMNGNEVSAATALPGLDLRRTEGRFAVVATSGAAIDINGLRYRFGESGGLVLDTRLDGPADAAFTFGPTGQLTAPAVAFISTDAVSAAAAGQEVALEAAAIHLAEEIRSLPPGAERTALLEQLRLHLAQAFDVKQALRAREIDRLEADIRELRVQWTTRQQQRDPIVERRLVDLVRSRQ